MIMLRRFALAAALTLGLAACGDGAGDEATPRSEAIAAIPAPEGASWADTATETPEGGYRIGNPDAPIKLVEYASHTCPHCADFAAEAMDEIRDKYVASGVVSFELRNQIHDAIDLTIARLARCGGDPASFQPLADQAWANLPQIIAPAQQNPQALQNAMSLPEEQRFPTLAQNLGLIDFFAARGLPREQQLTCLRDFASVTAIAERSNQQSEELNVTGTPTFFLNGREITLQSGPNAPSPWQQVEAALQNAGAR